MKPLKLSAKNFLGIKELDIDFEPGVYVIVGRNGSGKSSIFESILYALFGDTSRKAKIEELVNKETRRKPRVEFLFEYGGRVYKAVREIEGNRSVAGFFVRADGWKPLVKRSSEVANMVKGLLKMNFDMFQKTFLISQGRILEIIETFGKKGLRDLVMDYLGFLELKKTVKEYIEREAPIEKLENIRKRLSDLSERIRETQQDLERLGRDETEVYGEIDRIKKQREETEVELEKLENERRELEKKLEKLEKISEIEKLERKLNQLIPLAEKQKRAEKLRGVFQKLQDLQNKRDELNDLENHIRELEREISDLEKTREEKSKILGDMDRRIEELEGEIQTLKERHDRLSEIFQSSVKLREKLSGLKGKLESLDSEIRETESDVKNMEKERKVIEGEIRRLRKEREDLEERKRELEGEEMRWLAYRISQKLNEGDECPVCGGIYDPKNRPKESVAFNEAEYEDLLEKLENVKNDLSSLEAQLRHKREELEKLNGKIESLMNKRDEVNSKIQEILSEMEKMGYREGLEDDLKSLKVGIQKLERKLEKLRLDRDSVEKEIQDLDKRLAKLVEKMKNMKDMKSRLMEGMEKLEKEVNAELSENDVSIDEVRSYMAFLQELERDYVSEVNKLKGMLESLKDEVKGLKKEDAISTRRKLEKVKNAIKKLKEMRDELLKKQAELGSNLNQIRVLKRRLENLNSEFEKLGVEEKELEEREVIFEKIKSILNSREFDDYVFKRFMEDVLEIASSLLQQMTSGLFKIKPDPSTLVVKKAGIEIPANALSGGEKTLLALSLAMAMSNVFAQRVEMFFVDEGFAALDRENRRIVADMLSNFEVRDRVVVFITHHEDLASRFERVIRMENGRVVM